MLESPKYKRKVSNLDAMPENPNQKAGIESRHDVGEPEIKKEGKFRSNVKDPETKLRNRIQARCLRTRNKTKGSNSGTMPKNPKQNEGIDFEHDAREPETNERDRIWARCSRTRNKTNGSSAMPENPKQKEGIESGRNTRENESKGRDRI